MGVVLDDLYDHEGYAARRLADGTLTVTWSRASAAFDRYVACCRCGWRGGGHPPTDEGYEAAVDEWEVDHAQPLLDRTVPDEITSMVRTLEQAITVLMDERPVAVLSALRSLATWASVTVTKAQASLAPTVDSAQDDPVQEPTTRPMHPTYLALPSIERNTRLRGLPPPGLGL